MEAINSIKKTVGAEKANIEFEQLDLSSLQNINKCVDRSTFFMRSFKKRSFFEISVGPSVCPQSKINPGIVELS